eukprot:755355-Hanusia_phi.AAC.3
MYPPLQLSRERPEWREASSKLDTAYSIKCAGEDSLPVASFPFAVLPPLRSSTTPKGFPFARRSGQQRECWGDKLKNSYTLLEEQVLELTSGKRNSLLVHKLVFTDLRALQNSFVHGPPSKS